MIFCIKKELSAVQPETTTGEALKNAISSVTLTRLGPLQDKLIYARATLMDPRFKKEFLDAKVAGLAYSSLNSIVNNYRIPSVTDPIDTLSEVVTMPTNNLWSAVQTTIEHSRKNGPSSSGIEGSLASQALSSFIKMPLEPFNTNPEKFWKDNKFSLQLLYETACKVLLPPASSVPSERVASALNNLVNRKRTKIGDDYLSKRMFLFTAPKKIIRDALDSFT